MKHTKNKSNSNSNIPSTSPSKGKGDRGKGKGSVDSPSSGNNKSGTKDKDRRDSMSTGSEKELRGDSIELKDCPLRLPEFANVDHGKLVPRYTSVLRRSENDGIGFEDVDTLQLELEALLSATVVRKFTLKEESKVISNIEKYKSGGKLYKKDEMVLRGHQGPPSPGKRGISSKDIRSIKKLKSNSGKPIEAKVIGRPVGLPNIKKPDSGGPGFDPLQNEQIRPPQEASKPSLPKNETPSRFWAFVEPYCKDVTESDVKLLEDLMKTHSDMSEYFRVPKLGQHYTMRWAAEDMEYERTKSNANNDCENTDRNNTSGQPEGCDNLNESSNPSLLESASPRSSMQPRKKQRKSSHYNQNVITPNNFKYGDTVLARWYKDGRWCKATVINPEDIPLKIKKLNINENGNPTDYVIVRFHVDGYYAKIRKSKIKELEETTPGDHLKVDRMVKIGESAADKTPYGELTQRLVAGLIEDNLMTAVEDSMDSSKKQDADSTEKSKLIKSLNISNNEALEAKVKKELQDQGILDFNDDNDDSNENDEIQEELLRCQAELKAISAHNLQQLKRLTKAAKEEMARQELRNNLSHADQDVMEAYKKISTARSKKKPPTKKEREQAWKALKEREIILKQLESI